MDITQQLALSVQTVGKIFEQPSPAHPAGRYVVVQRVDEPNANFVLPGGQFVSVYPWFIPRNPRTPAQQANRMRLKLATTYIRTNGIPTGPRIDAIMLERNLPRWHAAMRWLLTESGLF